MPDYIYLLENRLSADQKSALRHLREAARQADRLLFLTGDAVRDLTSGHAVRDIEVAVSGNALDLKKVLQDSPARVDRSELMLWVATMAMHFAWRDSAKNFSSPVGSLSPQVAKD